METDNKVCTNVVPYLLGVICLLFILGLGGIIYHSFAPINIIDMQGAPPLSIENTNKKVHAGDILKVGFTYKKYRDVTGKVTDTLHNGVSIVIQRKSSHVPLSSDWKKTMTPLHLPHSLPPGKYWLRKTIEYPISMIRTVTEVFESEPFEILPSEKQNTVDKLQREFLEFKKNQTRHLNYSEMNNTLLKNQQLIMQQLKSISDDKLANIDERLEKLEKND